ncbi:MAG: AraC family transcriptional regulator [Spirochaetota bacterium]|nr:AraC family transcriptional regulator [Spirochaetota bacterium]
MTGTKLLQFNSVKNTIKNENLNLTKYEYEDFENVIITPKELGMGVIKYTNIRKDLILFTVNYKAPNHKTIITLQKYLNFMQFGFILSGYRTNIFENIDGKVTCQTNDTIFIPKHIPATVENNANELYKVLWIMFDPAIIYNFVRENAKFLSIELIEIMENNSDNFYYHKNKITPAMQAIIYQIINCPYKASIKRLYLEGKVLELMSLRLEQLLINENIIKTPNLSQKDIDKLHHARDLLIENMVNPPSLIDLAKTVGINLNKLKFGFRKLFNTTPFAYLKEQRLEKARLILETTNYSVTDIAFEVGYSDISHFSSLFKERFGIYPKSFKLKSRYIKTG